MEPLPPTQNEQANAWLWIISVSITLASLSLCYAALYGGGPHNYAGLLWVAFGLPAAFVQVVVITPWLGWRVLSGIGTNTPKADFMLAVGIAVAHVVGTLAIVLLGTRT